MSHVGSHSSFAAEGTALDLLVIQPTPFCNLNCSYCYLPDRGNSKQIQAPVLEKIFERVFASSIANRPFGIAWHAGEPLVMPIAFYENAFALAEKYNHRKIKLTHTVQTNGTTINRDWCEFLKRHDVKVGISVDGPEFLHDLNRKRRNGAGTFKRVRESIDLMNQHGVPFSFISVLTLRALDFPDELFDFYMSTGVSMVGFNLEEVEGPNKTSSLQVPEVKKKYARFLRRFYDLSRHADGAPRLRVREFDPVDEAFRHLKSNPSDGAALGSPFNQEALSGAILNVDYLGNFSTYSPELLGMPSEIYGDFSLGNVLSVGIDEALSSAKHALMEAAIRSGVAKCRAICEYFGLCGGGSPANKYYENGSFDSTATLVCELAKKIRIDVLKEKHGLAAAPADEMPVVGEELPADLSLPTHLLDAWWSEIAPRLTSEKEEALNDLSARVGAYLRFKGYRVSFTETGLLSLRQPGQASDAAGFADAGAVVMNLGEEPLTLKLGGGEKILAGGRAYRLQTGESASLGSTEGKAEIEVAFAIGVRG